MRAREAGKLTLDPYFPPFSSVSISLVSPPAYSRSPAAASPPPPSPVDHTALSLRKFLFPAIILSHSPNSSRVGYLRIFTSPSSLPNPVPQSHPTPRAKHLLWLLLPVCPHLQWIMYMSSNVPCLHSSHYPSLQLQHSFPGNLQVILSREAGNLGRSSLLPTFL